MDATSHTTLSCVPIRNEGHMRVDPAAGGASDSGAGVAHSAQLEPFRHEQEKDGDVMTAVPSHVRTSDRDVAYGNADTYDDPQVEREREHTTETRRSFATTEFWTMLVAAAAIMFSASPQDGVGIDHGWTLVAAVVVGSVLVVAPMRRDHRGCCHVGERDVRRFHLGPLCLPGAGRPLTLLECRRLLLPPLEPRDAAKSRNFDACGLKLSI